MWEELVFVCVTLNCVHCRAGVNKWLKILAPLNSEDKLASQEGTFSSVLARYFIRFLFVFSLVGINGNETHFGNRKAR